MFGHGRQGRGVRRGFTGRGVRRGFTGGGQGRGHDIADPPDGARLDPVRWRRPGARTVIRLTAALLLVGVAAASVWSDSGTCRPPAAASRQPDAKSPDTKSPDTRSPGSSAAPGSAAPGLVTGTGSIADPGLAAGPGPADVDGGAVAARPPMPPGTVGVPVRLAEPATLSLVRAGDRVDLVSVEPSGGAVSPIADDALVLAVTTETDPSAGGLLLALHPAAAHRAVGAAERARFAVLLRPGR